MELISKPACTWIKPGNKRKTAAAAAAAAEGGGHCSSGKEGKEEVDQLYKKPETVCEGNILVGHFKIGCVLLLQYFVSLQEEERAAMKVRMEQEYTTRQANKVRKENG